MEDTKYIHRTYVSSIEIIAVSLAFSAFYESDASQYLGSWIEYQVSNAHISSGSKIGKKKMTYIKIDTPPTKKLGILAKQNSR